MDTKQQIIENLVLNNECLKSVRNEVNNDAMFLTYVQLLNVASGEQQRAIYGLFAVNFKISEDAESIEHRIADATKATLETVIGKFE